MMVMLLPHKIYQKVKIKGKWCIIWIVAILEFSGSVLQAQVTTICVFTSTRTYIQLSFSYSRFFRDFVEGVLLYHINESIEGEKVFYVGFIVFIGVCVMMATVQGPLWRDLCLEKINPLEGTPLWISDYITRNWVEYILYYFKYTSALRRHGAPHTVKIVYFNS